MVNALARETVSTRWRSTVQMCTTSRGGRSRTAPHSGNSLPHKPVRSSASMVATAAGPAASITSRSLSAWRGHGVRSSGAVSDQPAKGRRRHRQTGGGRCGRHPQDQAGIAFGAGVAGQDHLAGELDDALVERTAHRPPQRGEPAARQRVGRGAQPGVDVVADGAGRVGKHARQVESVADAQRGADLVGVLGQQQFTAAAGDPVQFGADVEQCEVSLAERFGRRGQRSAGIDVGELRDRQGVEQLNVAQAAAAAS